MATRRQDTAKIPPPPPELASLIREDWIRDADGRPNCQDRGAPSNCIVIDGAEVCRDHYCSDIAKLRAQSAYAREVERLTGVPTDTNLRWQLEHRDPDAPRSCC